MQMEFSNNKKLTKGQINTMLKRQISDGESFNNLIEKPKAEFKQLKKGNTFYSVQVMKLWVQKFYTQVAALSQVLKGETLEETCYNVHGFLVKYIQYEIDQETQRVRSPANSWQNREKGIDCKSFSVFASAVLTNLGIKHYIRQIKQLRIQPNRFSHVYIVVPRNQETANLNDGYFPIDGTVTDFDIKPKYTQKEDIIMDELEHVGLNGFVVQKRDGSRKKVPNYQKNKKQSQNKQATSKKIFSFF